MWCVGDKFYVEISLNVNFLHKGCLCCDVCMRCKCDANLFTFHVSIAEWPFSFKMLFNHLSAVSVATAVCACSLDLLNP